MRYAKIITIQAAGAALGQWSGAGPAPAEDDEYSVTGSIGMYDDVYPVHIHFVDWINLTGTAQIFDYGTETTRAVVKSTATGLTGTAYTAEVQMAWNTTGTGQTATPIVLMSWQITQQGGRLVSEARDVMLRSTTLAGGSLVIQLDRPLITPVEPRGYSLSGFLGIQPDSGAAGGPADGPPADHPPNP
jgi:hypothetical protein